MQSFLPLSQFSHSHQERFYSPRDVAVLCVRFRPHNNLQFHEGGSCALESTAAAPQFAKSQLKTQKEGHEAPDTATDVRESHEVEKEHQDGYGNSVIPPGRGQVQLV